MKNVLRFKNSSINPIISLTIISFLNFSSVTMWFMILKAPFINYTILLNHSPKSLSFSLSIDLAIIVVGPGNFFICNFKCDYSVYVIMSMNGDRKCQ